MKSKELLSYGLIGVAIWYYFSRQSGNTGGQIPNPPIINQGPSTTSNFNPNNELGITSGGSPLGGYPNPNWANNNGQFLESAGGLRGIHGHGPNCGCHGDNAQSIILNY